MKLTEEQIQKLENYLDAKQLTYVDIRYEVLDHMVSDIENMMSTEKLSYGEAFKKSILKWNPQLKLSNSWIIGLIYHRPEIVIQKANTIFLKWFMLFISIYIISVFLSMQNTVAVMNTIFPFSFNIAVISALFLSVLFIVIWYIKILKSNIKSSYLFLFEKQVFLASLSLALIFLINFLSNDSILTNINIIYILLIPLTTVLGFSLFKKHQRIIRKYNLTK